MQKDRRFYIAIYLKNQYSAFLSKVIKIITTSVKELNFKITTMKVTQFLKGYIR